MTTTTVTQIKNEIELHKIFSNHLNKNKSETKSIRSTLNGGRLTMPRPVNESNVDESKVIVILHSKRNDGQLGLIKIVKNNNSGNQDMFMNVAEYDQPEVEYEMLVTKSIINSFDRLCNIEGWKLTELPGKIVQLSCENIGYCTMYNLRARHDLMSHTNNDCTHDSNDDYDRRMNEYRIRKRQTIRKMLDECLDYITLPSGLDFIESLSNQFERKGDLSPKQLISLQKWYGNIR